MSGFVTHAGFGTQTDVVKQKTEKTRQRHQRRAECSKTRRSENDNNNKSNNTTVDAPHESILFDGALCQHSNMPVMPFISPQNSLSTASASASASDAGLAQHQQQPIWSRDASCSLIDEEAMMPDVVASVVNECCDNIDSDGDDDLEQAALDKIMADFGDQIVVDSSDQGQNLEDTRNRTSCDFPTPVQPDSTPATVTSSASVACFIPSFPAQPVPPGAPPAAYGGMIGSHPPTRGVTPQMSYHPMPGGFPPQPHFGGFQHWQPPPQPFFQPTPFVSAEKQCLSRLRKMPKKNKKKSHQEFQTHSDVLPAPPLYEDVVGN